jgi:hypothetical protein
VLCTEGCEVFGDPGSGLEEAMALSKPIGYQAIKLLRNSFLVGRLPSQTTEIGNSRAFCESTELAHGH